MIERACRAWVMTLACLLAWNMGVRTAAAQTLDVPYVPTPWNVVETMLGVAAVGAGDYVIDLGSGDGRIVITAAKKYGARGLGVDLDSALVNTARREAQRQGVSDKATFAARNLFITDISEATVITMYLFPQVNMRLRPRLLKELKPGTRIVSHEFDMDEWQPDRKVTVSVPDKPYGAPSSDVFLWIVPADASGTWHWRTGEAGTDNEITLRQRFQMLQGEGRIAGRSVRIASGRVQGEEVRFTVSAEGGERAVQQEFIGRIRGDAMRGTVVARGAASEQRVWHAVRTARGTMQVGALATGMQQFNMVEER